MGAERLPNYETGGGGVHFRMVCPKCGGVSEHAAVRWDARLPDSLLVSCNRCGYFEPARIVPDGEV